MGELQSYKLGVAGSTPVRATIEIECGDGVTGSMRSSQLRGGVRFPDPLQGE